MQWTRREWIGGGIGLAIGAGPARSWADDPDLIVRNRRPLDAETPAEAFDRWSTPDRLFFVRSHFGPPAVGLSPWRLGLGGLIERQASLSLEDLRKDYEQVTVPAVAQCSGNGRAYFEPKVPGVAWGRGAVGNAEWGGVRLKDVLDRAGLKAKAAHVHLLGADGPPNPKTPAFFRSIPLDRALDAGTILATTMNGADLPVLHGGPLRLVVPGWAANHWIKWLRSITVADAEAPGFYMQTAYRLPRPGATRPDDLVPVTTLNVKSLIALPTTGARFPAGRVTLRGVAWTGPGRVASMDVSIDSGPWAPAELHGPDHPGSWRLWRHPLDLKPGRHTLAARATDSHGHTQPDRTPWNKSGYLWNGIDRVTVDIA
ncbi:MAG TPA: sulfite oxidase [Isosphaeraceae bacterium]|jgi:DMSO/TMAO reductase YedYZ molybdopterin-dependent catalytic subunit|nr:sulfite oxidase [Isosphaeraceae bacterium]